MCAVFVSSCVCTCMHVGAPRLYETETASVLPRHQAFLTQQPPALREREEERKRESEQSTRTLSLGEVTTCSAHSLEVSPDLRDILTVTPPPHLSTHSPTTPSSTTPSPQNKGSASLSLSC